MGTLWTRRGLRQAAALGAVAAACALPARAEGAGTLTQFIQRHYLESLGVLPALVLLALLWIIVGVDRYIRPDLKRTMRIIIAVLLSLVAQNYLEYRLAAGEPRWLARTLLAIYGYAARPAILALFLKVIEPQKRLGWAWALVGVNVAVNATALFSHICFWIDGKNHYQGGPLSGMCLWVSLILMACWFWMMARMFQPQKRKETWVPVLALGLILAALALDGNVGALDQPISYLTIAAVIGCLACYIWLHLQFVREHEQALMAGQRVQLMLSQIKPHFLHNSLAVIAELCDSDPQLAKAATVKFSKYLRGNMNSIDAARAIPFEKELSHTRLYLEIEQLRFEDALTVRYEIACTDFSIPALTVEPRVENAVRHGVRENPDGRGTVTIRTRQLPDAYEVSVVDDGPGFDPDHVQDDDRPHVGIENVRQRLRQVCGGTLDIRSTPGEGTTATIWLPRDDTRQ